MSKIQRTGELQKFQSSIVFPIVSNDDTLAYQFAGNGDKLDPLAFPLCLQDLEDLREGKYGDIQYDILKTDCAENTVLIRHPFRPYQLVPLDIAEERLIKDHLSDLALIFSALGASSVSQNVVIEEQQTLEIDANGKIKFKTVKANGDFKLKEEKTKESNIEFKIERIPGEDASYEKAHALAIKHKIADNPEIRDILKAFDPERGGRDESYVLNEELSSEYHKRIDVACKVSASQVFFNFEGKFDMDYKTFRRLRISREISFK